MSLGQLSEPLKITRHERLFLCARPSFDLPFRGNGIDDAIEILAIDQHNGAPLRRKSGKISRLMFCDALLEFAARGSCGIGTIGASKDVKPRAHMHASSFETAGCAGLLRAWPKKR